MKTTALPSFCAAMAMLATGAQAATAVADAGASAGELGELAKQLSNPVASLISVPFQANWDFGSGDGSGQKFTMNFQPVVPIPLNKDWTLILRTILPVIDQEGVFGPGSGRQSGLGDTTQSFFFSPANPGPSGVIWGLGPVGYYPTASEDLLGGGKWGLGPTLVVLKQTGGWTYGVLANQIWSVGGDSDRQNISSMFLQPFFSYTTKMHTSFTVNMESTYDWENEQWTIPLNLMVSQVFRIGKLPVSLQIGGRYYAEAPAGGPEWGLRATFTLLFPTKHEAAPAPAGYQK